MSIFNFASRLFMRISTSIHHAARLNKLREQNPTCRIMNASLQAVCLGESAAILDGVYLNQVSLGSFSYVSNNSKVVNTEIGNFCSIGPNVQIGLGPHPSRVFVSTYPAFYTDRNTGCPRSFRNDRIFDDSVPTTSIGNDVWIGANAIIPGGIAIADGAIVAAGSVVVKDIPSYAVVGGNPAQIIRYRFPEDHIALLQASKWWTWPIEKIVRNLDSFSDVERFKAIIN